MKYFGDLGGGGAPTTLKVHRGAQKPFEIYYLTYAVNTMA